VPNFSLVAKLQNEAVELRLTEQHCDEEQNKIFLALHKTVQTMGLLPSESEAVIFLAR
jgi:hypothetical protein